MGTAIEEYSIDNNFYPKASTLSELEAHVTPAYMRKLPERDGWGMEFFIDSDPGSYTLGSCGKGETSCGSLMLKGFGGKTSNFTDDVIFSNGSFVQWPEGRQR